MKMLKNQKGFTLVEMIVVIVILGILAGAAVPAYINLQTDAEAANNMAAIGALRSALAMRFGQQLVREGDNAAANDVIGSDSTEAPITKVQLEGLVATPIPTTLDLGGAAVAGACGTGTWVGLSPGNPPASTTWTLTCGATASDPLTIQ